MALSLHRLLAVVVSRPEGLTSSQSPEATTLSVSLALSLRRLSVAVVLWPKALTSLRFPEATTRLVSLALLLLRRSAAMVSRQEAPATEPRAASHSAAVFCPGCASLERLQARLEVASSAAPSAQGAMLTASSPARGQFDSAPPVALPTGWPTV